MSTAPHSVVSSSTFQYILDAASKEYKKKTGQDLRTHPFATELEQCNSSDGVLELLQKQADALEETGTSDRTLMKWLNPTVHVLYTFSETIGEGISLVSLIILPYHYTP